MTRELVGKILDAVADLEIGILALGDPPPVLEPTADYIMQKVQLMRNCEQAILAAIEEAGYICVGKEDYRPR